MRFCAPGASPGFSPSGELGLGEVAGSLGSPLTLFSSLLWLPREHDLDFRR